MGGGLKYIDQAYDEGIFPTFYANILAPFLAIAMASVIVFDSPSSTVFMTGMLVGVIVTKKVDNIAFFAGTACTGFFVLLLSQLFPIYFYLLPFACVLIAIIIDEIGDKIAHQYISNKYLQEILFYRPFTDIAVIGLIMSGFLDLIFLFPYFAFTFSYLAIEKVNSKGLNHAQLP